MQLPELIRSHIVISNNIEIEIAKLQKRLHPFRIVTFLVDDFKVDDAKAVIAEAYISESQTKYIILAAHNFNDISQNTLLKVLEEPPRNIEFILIAPTKSVFLPTICSRLPILQKQTSKEEIPLKLNLHKIDYKEIFEFLKLHSRIKKDEAKLLLEAIYIHATQKQKIALNSFQLDSFEKAYKLLELNAKPQNVFSWILMSFVKEKR